jgi:hypothetical protein
MIKIAHESPNELFTSVQQHTDYDYALVHLFEENEEYLNLFVDAIDSGREVILDNSIFELGEAFDADKFAFWIKKVKPTWYIIPDALEDVVTTVLNLQNWLKFNSDVPGRSIGVVQGKTYEEVVQCYQIIAPRVDKIAISFDYSFFKTWFPDEPTKFHSWMKGRQKLIADMLSDNIIDTSIPHHLLGCGLPQEFAAYREYTFIDSIDTSNPVVAGIKGVRYNGTSGLEDKPSQKLFTMIDYVCSKEEKDLVMYNIKNFRKIVNG